MLYTYLIIYHHIQAVTSAGAFPVVAGARRLAVNFCLASRGRHPQSAEACIEVNAR